MQFTSTTISWGPLQAMFGQAIKGASGRCQMLEQDNTPSKFLEVKTVVMVIGISGNSDEATMVGSSSAKGTWTVCAN